MIFLEKQERDKFALYLEGKNESDRQIMTQYDKLPAGVGELLTKDSKIKMAARQLVINELRGTEDQAL